MDQFSGVGSIVTFRVERMCGMSDNEIRKQRYALIFGALGGAVTASRWVVYSVRHNSYDPKRILWQLLTPVYSAVLAWVGVIAIAGGILILASSPNPIEPQYTFFIMGFAFLVGLASESFSHKMIMAARTLFGEQIEGEELKVAKAEAKDERPPENLKE